MDTTPLITPGGRFRGIGRYTLALIRALLSLSDPPDLVLFDPIHQVEVEACPDPVLPLVENPWLDVDRRPGWACFQTVQSWAYARRTRRPGEIYLFPFSGTTPWRLPPRSVAIVHDLIPSCYEPGASRRKLGGLRDALHGLRIQTAEKLISNSEATRQDACKVWGISPERIVPIPHLLLPLASPEALVTPRIQKILEGSPGYLLFLGAREERKGIGPLLDLWKTLRPEDARLVLAGPETCYLPEVEKRVQALVTRGDVTLVTNVTEEEKAGLLRGARALLFPSLYEGYGLPVAEAQLAGTPVVTFENSSIPEACGDGGYLFPTGDYQGLLQMGLELVRDPKKREEAAVRAQRRASLFDLPRVAEGFVAVFRQLVEGEAGS
jgi:glycosyltransferase involved in cell wall biosynthesis